MTAKRKVRSLADLRKEMLPAIEEKLQNEVEKAGGSGTEELRTMLRYHLGWEGEGAGSKAQGKRIRPLLVLLSAHASGGDWREALPAAASVELLHNFSLIHDDIQDNSSHRRGRPTLWKKWGVAQSINAGDSLFALAHEALKSLGERSTKIYAQSMEILPLSSLKLTQGQYMDLAFEEKSKVRIVEYWQMVEGKTAVLLATCCELGSIAAESDAAQVAAYAEFGRKLGLAFQVHDDVLGIWGSEEQTGKSVNSDLLSGKKSLPVLFGIAEGGKFAELWINWNFDESLVIQLSSALEEAGAKARSEAVVKELTAEAMAALVSAKPNEEGKSTLEALAIELVDRKH